MPVQQCNNRSGCITSFPDTSIFVLFCFPLFAAKTESNYKKINTISQEDFSTLAPRAEYQAQEVPPAPPTLAPEEQKKDEAQVKPEQDARPKDTPIKGIPQAMLKVERQISQSLPTAVSNTPHAREAMRPMGSRTPRTKDAQTTPRFYPVIKDSRPIDNKTPRKRKTKHSDNPPVESHVGWVMDSREHPSRSRTASIG